MMCFGCPDNKFIYITLRPSVRLEVKGRGPDIMPAVTACHTPQELK